LKTPQQQADQAVQWAGSGLMRARTLVITPHRCCGGNRLKQRSELALHEW
jgi:hypothetical protein